MLCADMLYVLSLKPLSRVEFGWSYGVSVFCLLWGPEWELNSSGLRPSK